MIDIACKPVRNQLQDNVSGDGILSRRGYRLLISCTLSLLCIVILTSKAEAQGVAAAGIMAMGASPNLVIAQAAAPIINTARPPTSTILPTDLVPLPTLQNRMTFGENMQLRILQKLPSRFYFSASVESTFRMETNIFQDPTKRVLQRQLLPQPNSFFTDSPSTQVSIVKELRNASHFDEVFRVLPTVTGGWTLTPHTRVYGSFFMIRDSVFHETSLSTDIFSYSYGVQHDWQIGQHWSVQGDLQFRELNQTHQHSVFDFMPGATLTWISPSFAPRCVFYVNGLIQIRGRKYFQAPTRELDPFYTWGMMTQRGRWSFSASSTLVQDFRKQFGSGALIPGVNSDSMISDFEIDRRIIPQFPGLQAFVRAEPIWNFDTHNHPGLAGMDFRLYSGIRFSMSKPALTSALDSLRRQLEEQDAEPPTPAPAPSGGAKPSAYLSPEHLTASRPQPIHGFLSEDANAAPVTEATWISAPQAIAGPGNITQ
jgi:hypothetical protein